MDGKRFYVLDGMRGVAAICVVVGHIVQAMYLKIFSSGMAVDMFFILSGFVLAYSYGERLASGLTYGQFVRIRLIRLYPMFLFGLLLGAPVLYACIAAGFVANSGFDSFTKVDVARTVLENAAFLPILVTRLRMATRPRTFRSCRPTILSGR
jgi:peptidoglycan/LPS O-acetylase OafA/YrhL